MNFNQNNNLLLGLENNQTNIILEQSQFNINKAILNIVNSSIINTGLIECENNDNNNNNDKENHQ